jgi:predicted PurR-regulated permease PerM
MAQGKDKNSVSVGFWMFALFLTVLPCIGFIMVLVWAFVGENETRKNYFRAVIAWHLVCAAILCALFVIGLWPKIQEQLQTWLQELR